ncbi:MULTISPECIES: hypothetical protein [Thermus]|uniref:hypothetical protein n=1 Tax=Thermus TaxID=270 RepID=UPI001F2A9D49|nr:MULTISPECIES: hypothetical protein [Thermus]
MLRKPLPTCTLSTPQGEKVYLPDLKGRPCVLVRDETLAQALALREGELQALGAQAFLLAQEPSPSPLPLLLDPKGTLLQTLPPSAVAITDAYLEVYHLGPVADVEEIFNWLRFVEMQCPECVMPEAEWT